MTFFIARVSNALPALQYICIGNLKLHIKRKDSLHPLKKQNGVLGLELPVHIEQNIVKLLDEDIIIVSSDGLNNYERHLVQNIDEFGDLHKLSEQIIEKFALKDDDAATLVARFKDTSQHAPREKKQKKASHKHKTNQQVKMPVLSVTDLYPQQELNPLSLSQNVTPLGKECFFASVNNSLASRQKIQTVVEFLALDKKNSIKIQTIVLELLTYEIVHLDLYVKDHTFQIQTPLIEKLAKKIVPLLGDARFNYKDNLMSIEYRLTKHIDTNNAEYEKIKQMLFFGLSEQNYEIYKKEKEKDKMLTNQSKLAAMGEMIGAIAHQWRQPLNELSLRIQLLKSIYKKDELDEEYIKQHIAKNMKTIRFMSDTIDDFRNFFRVDKKKNTFEIKQAIQEIANIQHAQLKNHDIELEITGDTFSFYGFKNEFQQVILNIISNAKDALQKNKTQDPKITIHTKQGLITINDNGGGIEKSVISRVFEPYFTTKDQGEGTGMGLYMSKMIVEDNLDGKIDLKNTKEGLEVSIKL